MSSPKPKTDLEKIKAHLLKKAPSVLSAAIIYGQFIHETANGTSPIYQQNNNLFGMKMPHIRKTLAVRPQNGYAYFNTHEDSIDDLFLWFDNQNFPIDKIGNVEAYASLLKKKEYYEDTYAHYVGGTKAGMDKF